MSRMEAKAWRKSHNGKAYIVKIGHSWTNDKGVINVELDAYPVPDDKGKVTFFLEVPRERDDAPRQGSRPAARPRDDLEDSVPF